VRSQAVAVEAGAAATEAVELHDYWKRRGVRLEGQRRALVQRGAAGGLFGDTQGAELACGACLPRSNSAH
jgi:hypothetical protein